MSIIRLKTKVKTVKTVKKIYRRSSFTLYIFTLKLTSRQQNVVQFKVHTYALFPNDKNN